MATLVLTLTNACAGGNHLTVNATVNGVDKGNYHVTVDQVLGTFDDREIETFLAGVIRLHKIGKTNAQVKTDLQAGLTVTI